MSNIEAQWLIEKRVIYACASGAVTVEFMEAHNQRMLKLLDEGIPLVHVILENNNFQPPAVSIRQTLNQLSFVRHPAIGWLLYINRGNLALDFTSLIMAKLLRIRYRRLDTRTEALDFLAEVVPDLDMTQVNHSLLDSVECG